MKQKLISIDVGTGSGHYALWKCSKHPDTHLYLAQVSNRTKQKKPTGCPHCSKLWHTHKDLFQNEFVAITKYSKSTPEIKKVDDILELPASLIANESVDITSVVSEKIEKILFQEGKFVKKNQLLVELTDSEEQAKLRQISAELEEAELNYERAKKLISK